MLYKGGWGGVRQCVRVVRRRAGVWRRLSPGERKLNMPDSISQSTATVLRINGREMSYCAIFVRDLCARPSLPPSRPRAPVRYVSPPRETLAFRLFPRSLAEADIAP